jgi:hypothetical protein
VSHVHLYYFPHVNVLKLNLTGSVKLVHKNQLVKDYNTSAVKTDQCRLAWCKTHHFKRVVHIYTLYIDDHIRKPSHWSRILIIRDENKFFQIVAKMLLNQDMEIRNGIYITRFRVVYNNRSITNECMARNSLHQANLHWSVLKSICGFNATACVYDHQYIRYKYAPPS